MEKIEVFKIEDFRKWLKKNHEKEHKVAVVIHKRHTGKPFPAYQDLMDEAICFGWIDTTIKRIDEDTFIRHFSKRTKASRWSDNTIKYAKRLIKEGRMTPQGLKFYKLGLAKPTHDHGIPKNPPMPPELKKALAKDKKASENFKNFPPSTKRTLYRWYLRAKMPETKERRIKAIIKVIKENQRSIF